MRRRGFLGTMLGAAAAAPAAVFKSVGVAETSLGLGGLPPSVGLLSTFGGDSPQPVGDYSNWWLKDLAKFKTLRTLAPWWFEQKRRDESRNVYVLDVDLAAHRSISPAAKISIQRERNYRLNIEREERHLTVRAQEFAFNRMDGSQ